jgi:glutathione S-transferase
MAVHVALEELGLSYETEMIDIKNGDNRKEDYLKINPRGQVAALQTDEGIVTENAAIMIYLSDKHKGDLIPAEGHARAIALQWLMFANSGLHGAYGRVMFLKKNDCPDQGVMDAALKAVQDQWDEIERHLTSCGTEYLAGNDVTAGDIYVTVVANWDFLPKKPDFGPKTKALLEKVSARPSFKTVLMTEDVEYKAAA